MPEGDSIRRLADRLGPLIGQTIARASTQGVPRDLAGRAVVGIDTHGKHLSIELDDGTQIRTHLGMKGRGRIYDRAAGEAALARISPGRARLVLATDTHLCAFVDAPTVEIATRRAPLRGMVVGSLGPDVLAADFDAPAAAERALARRGRAIGEVLLDQRVAAGIGNIWKSEACFACGIDPRTPVEALARDRVAALYVAARELMLANVRRAAPRASRDRFMVYGRTNRVCARCAHPIETYRAGDPPRWTWSCPRCQARPDPTALSR